MTALEKKLTAKVVHLKKELNNEIHDVQMLEEHCSRVYAYMTDGRITKATTLPEVVIATFEDLDTERQEERDKAILDKLSKEVEIDIADVREAFLEF